MAGNIQNSYIIPFQLFRGVLFATFVLPVVLMYRNKSHKLLISLILIYTTTAIVLIIPNFLFPDTVCWAHFIEMITSMILFSVITWLVWQKRNPTNKSKYFWDKLAKSYDKRVKKVYDKAYQDTIKLSRNYLDPTHNVLDFACGSGITTIELSKNVKKITAIDISEKMIEVAKQKTIDKNINNIEFKQADLFESQLNDTKYNAVLAFNILCFIEDLDEVLIRVKDLLLPSGIFISATDCLREKRSFSTMVNTFLSKFGLIPFIKKYSMAELEDAIRRNGFDIIETKNLHDNPPNYYIVAKKNGCLTCS